METTGLTTRISGPSDQRLEFNYVPVIWGMFRIERTCQGEKPWGDTISLTSSLFGVTDGDRTRDYQDHNLELYQLNYRHMNSHSRETIRVTSYMPDASKGHPDPTTWSPHSGLNRGPDAYKATALPLSYRGTNWC